MPPPQISPNPAMAQMRCAIARLTGTGIQNRKRPCARRPNERSAHPDVASRDDARSDPPRDGRSRAWCADACVRAHVRSETRLRKSGLRAKGPTPPPRRWRWRRTARAFRFARSDCWWPSPTRLARVASSGRWAGFGLASGCGGACAASQERAVRCSPREAPQGGLPKTRAILAVVFAV